MLFTVGFPVLTCSPNSYTDDGSDEGEEISHCHVHNLTGCQAALDAD